MSFFKDALKSVRRSFTSRPSDASQTHEYDKNDRDSRISVFNRPSEFDRETIIGRNSIIANPTSTLDTTSGIKPLKSAMSKRSSLAPTDIHVSWKKKVGVVLVPSLSEYLDAGCDLWWSATELDDTRREFQREINDEMSVDPSLRCVKDAIIKLCRIAGTIAYVDPSYHSDARSGNSSGSNPLELNVEARNRANSITKNSGTSATASPSSSATPTVSVSQDLRGIPTLKVSSGGIEVSIESCDECGATYDRSISRDCVECAKRAYCPMSTAL